MSLRLHVFVEENVSPKQIFILELSILLACCNLSTNCNKLVNFIKLQQVCYKKSVEICRQTCCSSRVLAAYTKSKSLSYRYNHVNLGSVVRKVNSAVHRIVISSNLLNMLRTRAKIHQVDATLFVEKRLNNVVIKVQQHLLN